MEKGCLIKKVWVLFFCFACLTGKAKGADDPVIMTVAGKQIPLSEFLFIAGKNNEVDLSDAKSAKEYVELFKNFKLKVADAEAAGLDTTQAFRDELEEYKAQLISTYLSNKEAEEALARTIYDRQSEILEVSHILFKLPEKTIAKDTVSVYQQAMQVYEQVKNGDDFESFGKKLAADDPRYFAYEHIRALQPAYRTKAFEDAAYSTPAGGVSAPFRTRDGFHLVKVHSRTPNPGSIQVAHILLALPKDSAARDETEALAAELCKRARNGEDFGELAREYSSDNTRDNGGVLPPFGMGGVLKSFEEAAFALTVPGEVSDPVKTVYGYHIIRLIEKTGLPSFDNEKYYIIQALRQSGRGAELTPLAGELKKGYGYTCYPEAYAELRRLCDDYFPSDRAFEENAKGMDKPLFRLAGTDYTQKEFVQYLSQNPYSTQTCSGDFLQEVFDAFVRERIGAIKLQDMDVRYPEYAHLVQEYRDGILLFEISNRKIWSQPVEEQAELEKRWIKELNGKYPVTINRKLLGKLKHN
ncbi:MAG: peptidylprolyl isomerase [Tannerellaceae bacterium]|jgi:peptidyl-prolyl cis-trans isomerase SurA|nr:peptidylprolyl isomerase [Tannerellaceae bacterium]